MSSEARCDLHSRTRPPYAVQRAVHPSPELLPIPCTVLAFILITATTFPLRIPRRQTPLHEHGMVVEFLYSVSHFHHLGISDRNPSPACIGPEDVLIAIPFPPLHRFSLDFEFWPWRTSFLDRTSTWGNGYLRNLLRGIIREAERARSRLLLLQSLLLLPLHRLAPRSDLSIIPPFICCIGPLIWCNQHTSQEKLAKHNPTVVLVPPSIHED